MSLLKNNLRQYFKANYAAIIVFIALVVLSHLDGNASMIFGGIAVLYAICLFLKLLFLSLAWIIQRSVARRQAMQRTSIRLAFIAVLSALSLHGMMYVNRKVDRTMQPVIEKLETYKTAHGEYPKSLDAIMDNPPLCPYAVPPYHLDDKSEQYCLTCMTYGFNHHSYCPGRGGWRDWD